MNRIPLSKPLITDEMIDAASNALRNERLVLGESVYKFEEQFAKYIGTDCAVAVSSGTAALVLALMGLNVRGKEIITTPLSFIATANSIVYSEGIPVFADVDEGTYCIDPAQVIGRISEKTCGILPVHLYGYPCPMDDIKDIARRKGLVIVEDAAQAHGAIYKGRRIGSFGEAGCFSFYPTKNLTVAGDGGMVTTNDSVLASKLRKLRDCGRASRYLHDVFGFTARLNTVNAAIGLVQLKHIEEWNERRRSIAKRYVSKLGNIEEIKLPPMGSADIRPVFHLFVIRCQKRNELAQYLEANGIECGIHYPIPIHLQPIYRSTYNYQEGSFSMSERISREVLSLPMYPALTSHEVDYICEKIADFYGGTVR
ncbi:MAG: DegT/DnrJ/EryC1/StrS family aminotransferase [Methanomassiliicoccales archaeon]